MEDCGEADCKKKKKAALRTPETRARHPTVLDVCFRLIPFIISLCEIPGPCCAASIIIKLCFSSRGMTSSELHKFPQI